MGEKVNAKNSIRTILSILVGVAIIITGVFMIFVYSPAAKEELAGMSQNYLKDLSVAYGNLLQKEINLLGKEDALSAENLAESLDGVGLAGVESSYVYVVSPDATMLYHPTAEKIGQPVENEVVKGVTVDLQAGKKVENKVVTYEFKGANKYAAYFVNESEDFILVVTTDEEEIFQPIRTINMRGIIGLIVCCIICFSVDFFLIHRIVIKPILKIEQLTAKVATMDFSESEAQGRLNRRKDEIGIMARSLSILREQLKEIVISIREHSDALVASADALNTGANSTNTTMMQVENAVQDIASGATNQAEETQEATENVLIIGDMVKDTTATVDRLMASAEQVSAANDHAQQILRELRAINQQSGEYIDIIAKQTEVTNESAMKIGEATKLISDIAEETNLLSLNASIEAARAGEHGRGFAVVASEIQKLAEQSNESARTIEVIINMLLEDSEKAVHTMGQVKSIIDEQTKHIKRTDEAFQEIKIGVTDSIAGMQEIAEKTKQMDAARVNVVDVVSSLTAIAEENAAATEETSASVVEVADIVTGIADKANDLNAIATELEEKMGIFKL